MVVSALIVTYGHRFSFLREVVNACIYEGVDFIYVIDNFSTSESRLNLHNLEESIDNLFVEYLAENRGSSGGFKAAIKKVQKDSRGGYLWFLDDDNVPIPGALNALKEAYKTIQEQYPDPVLYSYRGASRENDYRAFHEGYIKGISPNSFCAFHLFEKVNLKKRKQRILNHPNLKIMPTKIGPYGGLFSSVENINKIGYPNEDFFVYADDHDFTFRFEENKCTQFLVFESQLKDIDISFSKGEGYFNANSSGLKIYYGLRNHIFLDQKFINNKWIYNLNKTIFLSHLGINALKKFFSSPRLVTNRFKLILKAISDGTKGNLGKTFPG